MEKLLLVTVVALAAATFATAKIPEETGMDQSARAYEHVCWYEANKPYAAGDSVDCDPKKMEQDRDGTLDWAQKYPDSLAQVIRMQFGIFAHDSLNTLGQSYEGCGSYLDSPDNDYGGDQSGLLTDDGSSNYPWRGFAHCMVATLYQKYGDKAVQAVQSGQMPKGKSFAQALLETDNGHRSKHGVPPFQLDDELTRRAQDYANEMAQTCHFDHLGNIRPNDPALTYKGTGTGENIFAGSSKPNPNEERLGHEASDDWYSEVKNYPFPYSMDDLSKADFENTFKNVGHFTQTVWEGTTLAGYAYAVSPPGYCTGTYNLYVVGRYSIPGNLPGTFKTNVHPAQY